MRMREQGFLKYQFKYETFSRLADGDRKVRVAGVYLYVGVFCVSLCPTGLLDFFGIFGFSAFNGSL